MDSTPSPEEFPYIAFDSRGHPLLSGTDPALEARLGLPPEIQAVQTQMGAILTMYDATKVTPTPFGGTMDASHQQHDTAITVP